MVGAERGGGELHGAGGGRKQQVGIAGVAIAGAVQRLHVGEVRRRAKRSVLPTGSVDQRAQRREPLQRVLRAGGRVKERAQPRSSFIRARLSRPKSHAW